MTRTKTVVVRHLEMASPGLLRPSSSAPPGIRVRREPEATAAGLARECYALVGGPWHWTDRLHLDEAGWQALLEEEQGEVWVAREAETIVGYFQLAHRAPDVEIHYFGLAPSHIGRGIGGWLLTRAVERAWALGPRRVVLNTCSLDGPAALPNYLARGFTVMREEQRIREVA
jgi:GNAT superfamily N-acetyltransferase